MLSLSKHIRFGSLLALGACSPASEAPSGETIACALDGSTRFVVNCGLERGAGELIVRHPDGGFRRFTLDGDRLAAADGAQPAEVRMLADNVAQVSVAADRYRIPLDAPDR